MRLAPEGGACRGCACGMACGVVLTHNGGGAVLPFGTPTSCAALRLCVAPVTFGLNVRLDLSWEAMTESLCSLVTKLLLQVLGKSTWTVTIRVIHGDEGVGDIPGV